MTAIHGVLAGGTEDEGDPIVVTITPTSTGISGANPTTALSTPTVTASAVGGIGVYTYAWTVVSSSHVSAAVSSPSSATTAFTCDIGLFEFATFRCTVDNLIGPSAPQYKNIYVTWAGF